MTLQRREFMKSAGAVILGGIMGGCSGKAELGADDNKPNFIYSIHGSLDLSIKAFKK